MEKELYKNRSISSCIKMAYLLFCSNVMTILRRNWLPLLAFTIMEGVVTAWLIQHGNSLLEDNRSTSFFVLSPLLSLLYVAAMVWYMGSTTNLLNENGFRCNLLRNLKLTVFIGLIFIVLFAGVIAWQLTTLQPIATGQEMQQTGANVQMWIFPLCLLVFTLLLLPLSYSYMNYIQAPKARFKTHVIGGYFSGFRHFGYIFSTQLLFGVIIFFLTIVVAMPLYLLVFSHTLSQQGVLQGDVNTLPSYFSILLYGCSILTGFILIAIMTVGVYVNYYMYGAIVAKKKARRQRKEIQTKTSEG